MAATTATTPTPLIDPTIASILPIAFGPKRSVELLKSFFATGKCLIASDGEAKFTFSVTSEVGNLMRKLHGGVYAVLADEVSTIAIMSKDKARRSGVSVHLSTEYLSSIPVGETIVVHATCDKIGKTMGFASINFYDEKGKILATSRHTKFLGMGAKL
eukprot:TRINITY_DN1404_c0_g1_i1.p1 TRINITY_DN1404_c0_g1~~TRINITY_DN1404_c0_g1_i1.p1  ORF type:complete len:169 (+),score=39.03 TRINITY_DN1404_c0_g1_i1:34-507(+)